MTRPETLSASSVGMSAGALPARANTSGTCRWPPGRCHRRLACPHRRCRMGIRSPGSRSRRAGSRRCPDSPGRAALPDAGAQVFVTNTSQLAAIRSRAARPSGCATSSSTFRLFRSRFSDTPDRPRTGPRLIVRLMSPCRFSMVITSAPRSPRICVASGAHHDRREVEHAHPGQRTRPLPSWFAVAPGSPRSSFPRSGSAVMCGLR